MRKIRTCKNAQMNTGSSACKIDWGKVKGAIIVDHGIKLPEEITGEVLAELCHADRPTRIYPILPFLEYAKNGGEPQVSAVGYGSNQYNGLNAQTDTFTLGHFDEILNMQLLKCAGKEWDVYFWNNDNMLIGYNDGTDILAGIPMSTIYPTVTPFATSGAKSTMTVSFCHTDAEDSQKNFDFIQLDINPKNYLKGLVEIVFEKAKTENAYKIIEKVGGYDRTFEFGSLIADGAAEIMNNVTSATYADGIITIVPKAGALPSLKAPSVLFEKGIKGIEQIA
ncbi:hypothetical protein [Bacteroides sp.]|uniref:hypothetical protein n=1 Tax=Bacteroides sp. TaxID=29523 RepID=UPI0026028225|nr:hypothetical protein [Bacteroides sp.]MDD3038823.1 hypothetical protein [Bacteroides sp.]